MAKNSKRNINDRIKKSVPDNEWLRNAAKSFGFTSLDVVKSLLPDTSDTVEWNAKVIIDSMDMINNIRDNNGIRNAFNKQFQNIPQIKASKMIVKNAFDDIKTGNFYNKGRLEGTDDAFDDFGDMFGDDSGPQFIDEGDDFSSEPQFSEDDSSNSSSRPPVAVINTMPLAKSIAASTEATVNTMVAISDQQMAVETEKAMFTQRANGVFLNALTSINDNLALLVQFNSDSTAKFHAAATEYYSQSIDLLKNIENAGKSEGKERKRKRVLDMFTSSGGIKGDEYLKQLKQNLIDIKDENPIIGNIVDQVLNMDVLTGIAQNPIGTLVPMVVQGVLSETFKSTLGALDKRVNSVMPALLARINSFEDNDNTLLNGINKLLGTNPKVSKYVKLGDYEKGTITWDGESKKALVEVIPTYLRRIESALTGREERIYDYDSGEFVPYKKLKENYEKRLTSQYTSGYVNLETEMMDIVRKMNLNTKDLDQFKKDMEEYFTVMTKQGHRINHRKYKNLAGDEIDEFEDLQLFEGDPIRTEFMRKVLEGVNPTTLVESAAMGIQDSINAVNKFYDDIRFNTNKYGYSSLNNEVDENGKVKFQGLKPGGMRDEFGLSQLDYLRDIRSALINGIRVFPDNTKKGRSGIPNAELLQKEKDENTTIARRKQREKDKKDKNDDIINKDKNRMNSIVAGSESEWAKYYNEHEKIEFNTDTKRGKFLQSVSDFNDKVDGHLFEILYGDEDIAKKYANKVIDYGRSGKPLVTLMTGMFGDTIKAFKSYFTGQGYVTSDGVKVEGRPDNMIDKVFGFFTGLKDKLTKGKDGEDGLIQKMTKDFMAGFEKFKVNLFGEKFLSENDAKETFQDLAQKVKERLPKALGYGLAGGMVKTFFSSRLGLLGNFLLPGGPMGAVLAGTAYGFLRQSETFNRVVFGEQGEDGERLGGIISKELQDKYAEYKGSIKSGIGLGVLGSLFLPGGPILSSVLGIGAVMTAKSDAFQEFLYGKDFANKDNKSLMDGAFGNMFKRLSGNENPELATFLGTAGLGVGIAQGVGLLPAFLLPGGPIVGALMGLAGGIAASSEKFQKFLLGEKDIDGQRYGGLLTKFKNWFDVSFTQPLKIRVQEMQDDMYGFLKGKLFDPIARSFEPVAQALKFMASDAFDLMKNIGTSIVESFKESIINPISEKLKWILSPIGWVVKSMGKLLTGVVTSPLKLIGAIGTVSEKYNEHYVIKKEKRRRAEEFDASYTGDEGLRYFERRKAAHMSKEEKEALINEKLAYRHGKSRKERKKEQEEKLNAEMQKRKAKTEEMRQQYEDDKEFAKKHGFKYASKKQKEKREQELKVKSAWIQEQSLVQAQETDEKVSKIADNVVHLSDYRDSVVDKLDEVNNTLKDGLNKLNNQGQNSDISKNINNDPDMDPANYGKVTDEHLAPIYDFIAKHEAKYGKNTSVPDTRDESDYGKVTDEHLATIHNFIDKYEEKHGTTLQESLDNLNEKIVSNKEPKAEEEKVEEPKVEQPKSQAKIVIENEETLGTKMKKGISKLLKNLRKKGRSHAEGLDEVPGDGYIAELHKGEMVVPEKPAGLLRGMMDKAGKGFKGLTDKLLGGNEEEKVEKEGGIDIDGDGDTDGEPSMLSGILKGLSSVVGGMGGLLGKVAGMGDGEARDRNDNALGMTDEEAERMKELEDRARYAQASRKDVDFVQNQIAARDKEKADRQWKEDLLTAIRGIGSLGAASLDSGMSLFDLIGAGFDSLGSSLGSILKSLAIPLGVFSLLKTWKDHKNSEEYIESRTDVDGSMIYDNTDHVVKKNLWSARKAIKNPIKKVIKKFTEPYVEGAKAIYNSEWGKKNLQPFGNRVKEHIQNAKNKFNFFGKPKAADNVVDFASAKAAKEGAESAAKNATTKGGAKVINFADAKLAKEATEKGSGKVLKKIAGEGVENLGDNKSVMSKLIKMTKTALTEIGQKVAEKFPKMGKFLSKADGIFAALLKNADMLVPKFAKKIGAVIGKVTAGASTAFITDLVFAAGDLISGFTAGNAGNLFGVSPENVDFKMRTISSVLQTVTNFNVLALISLVNEICSAVWNFNFLRNIAIWIYNAIPGGNNLGSRITAKEIDACTSIDQALMIMGVTDAEDIAYLKDGNGWKDFSKVPNEELHGVISATEQMELARLQYNLENETKLSSQAFIDKESKTLGSKIWGAITKPFQKKTDKQKLMKYQNKVNIYEEKLANSNNWFTRTWNGWRLNSNKKKMAKYQDKLNAPSNNYEVGEVVNPDDYASMTTPILNGRAADPAEVQAILDAHNLSGPEMGDQIITDAYGNSYDANGNFLGNAGYGDGPEMGDQIITDAYGNSYDANGNFLGNAGYGDGPEMGDIEYASTPAKKPSLLKKVGKTMIELMPGGKALTTGITAFSTLFGKDNKPEDYRMVPILDEYGNIVSYQSQLIDDTTELEGLNYEENIQMKPLDSNTQIIPQTDENGNIVSYTTVNKNKPTGLFGRIKNAFSNMFGIGQTTTTTGSSVDNSSSVTNNTGDTYTTNNTTEVDTSMFGALTEAINNLAGGDSSHLTKEGKVETSVLGAILNPINYVTKKLTEAGVNVSEAVTGKEMSPEKKNAMVAVMDMITNPIGFMMNKMNLNEKGESKKEANEPGFLTKTKDKAGNLWAGFKNQVFNEKPLLAQGLDSLAGGFDNATNWINNTDEAIKGKYKGAKKWVGDKWQEFNDLTAPLYEEGDRAGTKTAKLVKAGAVAVPYFGYKKFIEGTAVDKAAKKGIKAVKDTYAWGKGKWDDQKAWISSDWEEGDSAGVKFGKSYLKIEKTIKKKLSDIADSLSNWFKNTIQGIKDFYNETKTKIKNWWNDTIDSIGDWFKKKKEDLVNWYEMKTEELSKSWDGFVDSFKNFFGTIGEKLNGTWEAIKNFKMPKITWEGITLAAKDVWYFLEDFAREMVGLEPKKRGEEDTTTTNNTNTKNSTKKTEEKKDDKNIIQKGISFVSDTYNTFKQGHEAGGSGIDSTARKFRPKKYVASDTDFIKSTTTNNDNSNSNNTTNTSNKFVFYSQSDNRWANTKLGNKNMKDAGCGPTSLAMAVSQLTGEQITPDTIAELGKEHLPGYSKYSLFPSVANKLNMNYSEGYDGNFITSNLQRGVPVVLSGRTNASGTPYTSEGHVVTATHMMGNKVFINDPRGKEYSGYYPINALLTGLNKGMIVSPHNASNVTKFSSGQLANGWDAEPYKDIYAEELGMYGDVGEYNAIDDDKNLGKTGAGQITMADRVLSYARAFLNNTSKFSYSQPRRLQIDTNKSSSKGCGADCSSFVSHVLSRAGDVNIYGTTSQTFWDSVGTKVSEPQIGDVVCQQNHVGLYSGDGNYIHMSGRKAGIKESKAIQKGNNKHRGYKRVLKNPSQMVDPTVPNPNSFLGTVVGTSSGNPVGGGSGGPQASLDKALLIGDSLTVGMKSVLEGKYSGAKAMGKGGKWAKHWLESLDELPDAESVSTVIQWLGINGVHDNKRNISDSQTLLGKLKEKYAGKPIFNMRIFPTTKDYSYGNYTGEWWRGLSKEFNDAMGTWAGSNGVTQIDATNGFIQEDGFLDPSKAVDGIHFTTDGYKAVLSNIETAINSYNSNNSGSTATGGGAAPQVDILGQFSELEKIGTSMVGAIFNNKSVKEMYDNFYGNQVVTDATTTGSTPTDGSNPDISGISDTAQAVWQFFTGKGYSPAATAGIMGNMEQESGMRPDIIQGNGRGPAAGICQWENYNTKSARWKDMNAHAQSKGKDWKDLQSQLEFIDIELQGKSPGDNYTSTLLKKNWGGYEGFKAITDYKKATEAFEKSFERARKINWNNRYAGAKKYYDKFAGGAGTGPATATAAETAPSDGSIPDSMNGWKYYQQSDPKWAGDVGGSSVSRGGCGPTSHAMMLSTIFGKQITPLTMTRWGRKNGTWTGAMQWTMPEKVASAFGLNMTTLGADYNGVDKSVLEKVKESLKAGKPVVMTGKGTGPSGAAARQDTPFTPGGHVVLAVGVDGQGNVIINDPRGAGRTKAYTDKGILDVGVGLRGAWAFDTNGGSIPDGFQVDGDYTPTGGTTGGTTEGGGAATVAAPQLDIMGKFGELEKIGTSMVAGIFNNKSTKTMYDMLYNNVADTSGTTTTPADGSNPSQTVTGKGNFPKYALNDQQIKGIANILQHEQPGIEGRMAEASLMANLVDKTGDDKATVDNLIKKATGGWFAKGKDRFNNPGNPEQISIDAAKTVLVEGKRTLPRYVDEHDCFSDLTSVTNDGKSFKASDRSQYKPFVTKIKNRYGASGTFHSFPNAKSDPFYYTSEELRQKWGDDCYSPTLSGDAGKGDGNTYMVSPRQRTTPTSKVTYTKPVSNRPSPNINVDAQRKLDDINRKMNLSINNINATDPKAYAEILKLMMRELQAINNNTAETASKVGNIEIVGANEPIRHDQAGITTADIYQPANSPRQKNNSKGYNVARQIAGYQK